MTKHKFIFELREQRGVRFDGSDLLTGRREVAMALAETLNQALPGSANVEYGLELSSLRNGTDGELNWLLALSNGLMEVRASFRQEDDRRLLSVRHHFLPAIAIQRIDVQSTYTPLSDRICPEAAHVWLDFGSETIKIDSGPGLDMRAVMKFAAAVSLLGAKHAA